jgi:hypothetical protein
MQDHIYEEAATDDAGVPFSPDSYSELQKHSTYTSPYDSYHKGETSENTLYSRGGGG